MKSLMRNGDIRIALPTPARAGGTLARRTLAISEEESFLHNGQPNLAKSIDANAPVERSVAGFGARAGKSRPAEHAGLSPR